LATTSTTSCPTATLFDNASGRNIECALEPEQVRLRPTDMPVQRVVLSVLFALSPLPSAVSVTWFAVSMHPPWFSPKVRTNTGRLSSAGSERQLVPHLHRSYSALRLPALVGLSSGFSLAFDLPAFPGIAGSLKLLGHPFRTRHGIVLHRSARPSPSSGFAVLPSGHLNPWASGTSFTELNYCGSHASPSSHRRRRCLGRRKTRFRPAGSALVELESHQPVDCSEFHDVFVFLIPF